MIYIKKLLTACLTKMITAVSKTQDNTITGFTTFSTAPVMPKFALKSFSTTNMSKSANNNTSSSFNIAVTGYTPICLMGWKFDNSATNGKSCSLCRTYRFALSSTTATINWKIYAYDGKVDLTIYVLYYKN